MPLKKAKIRRPRRATIAQCQDAYAVELARGASHISSTLSDKTRKAAIEETLESFRRLRGDDDLPTFTWLLAQRLDERQRPDAAAAVRQYLDLDSVAVPRDPSPGPTRVRVAA